MRLFRPFLALTTLLTSTLANSASKPKDPNTLSIYAWPLTAEKPTPIAIIKLNPSSDNPVPSASLFKYNAPSFPGTDADIIRVGILDPTTEKWTGTAVSKAAFARGYDRKFLLQFDEKTKQVWHVSLLASEVPPFVVDKKIKDKQAIAEAKKKAKEPLRAGQTTAEIVPAQTAPLPVLNRPIQLNVDGKVPEVEGDQRTFLQK